MLEFFDTFFLFQDKGWGVVINTIPNLLLLVFALRVLKPFVEMVIEFLATEAIGMVLSLWNKILEFLEFVYDGIFGDK